MRVVASDGDGASLEHDERAARVLIERLSREGASERQIVRELAQSGAAVRASSPGILRQALERLRGTRAA